MFELKEKSQVKVSIYGKEYSLTKPTVAQVRWLNKESVGKSEQESFEILSQWVCKLGLPSEVVEDMELEHFSQLVSHLSSAKK